MGNIWTLRKSLHVFQQSNIVTKTEPPISPLKSETVVKQAVAKPAVVPPTMAQPTVQKAAAIKRSVLVIEDSPTSRKVISMVLSRKGYEVNEAATGREALRMVVDQFPHLILLDAMLPDMTGYDILAQLKTRPATKGNSCCYAYSKRQSDRQGERNASRVSGLSDQAF